MPVFPGTGAARSLPRQPAGAVVLSLAAVLFFTAALGAVFLPGEISRESKDQCRSITKCRFVDPDQRVVAFTWFKSPGRLGGFRREITLHDLARGEPPRVLVSAALEPLEMALSADGTKVFFGLADGRIFVVNPREPGRRPRLVTAHQFAEWTELECLPDGSLLVTRGLDVVCAWSVAQQRLAWRRDDLRVECWAVDPSGRRLVCSLDSGQLVELDALTGRTLRVLASFPAPPLAATISPDGRLVALLGPGGQLMLLDLASGEPVWSPGGRARGAYHAPGTLAFSPCGQWLTATADRDVKSLVVWSVATGRPVRELRGHEAPVSGAAFTADGRLHSWAVDGTIRIWQCGPGSAPRPAPLTIRLAAHGGASYE